VITYTIENLPAVLERFKDIQNRLLKPETVMEVCAAKGWRDVIEHFENCEGPDGEWEPLKEITIMRREHGGTKPLQDTGMLKANTRYRVVGKQAHVFTDDIRAPTHNFGDTRKWGKRTVTIPARPFMWLSEKAKESIAKTLMRYTMEGANFDEP
jgi:phage gpG-like protein